MDMNFGSICGSTKSVTIIRSGGTYFENCHANNSININGKKIRLKGNVRMTTDRNGRFLIDGKPLSEYIEHADDYAPVAVNIVVEGDCQSIEGDCDTITVKGNVGKVKTHNGDIEAGSIGGNVTTHNGNIKATTINGDCETYNGNIYKR